MNEFVSQASIHKPILGHSAAPCMLASNYCNEFCKLTFSRAGRRGSTDELFQSCNLKFNPVLLLYLTVYCRLQTIGQPDEKSVLRKHAVHRQNVKAGHHLFKVIFFIKIERN